MDWFRRLNGRATSQPARPQTGQYYYEDYPTMRRKLEANDRELARLVRDNQFIKNTIKSLTQRHLTDAESIRQANNLCKDLSQQHLADSEKIRRLNHLLAEARENTTKISMQHREEIGGLYNKINSLQQENGMVDDERIINEMRRLGQKLESWVNLNFKDAEKLASFTTESTDDFPKTAHQRRACIQASICGIICQSIFIPKYFSLPADLGRFLRDLESGLNERCPDRILQSWRAGTCAAIDYLTERDKEIILSDHVDYIEGQYARYSSTKFEPRIRQLERLLRDCSNFKSLLSRQHEKFEFYCSPLGADFLPSTMSFGGGVGQADAKVRLSLWPALVKDSPENSSQIMETELVWTMPS